MPDELERLSSLLAATSADDRVQAVRRLASFDPGPRPPGGSERHALTTDRLAELLRGDPSDEVRVEAASTLTGFQDARAFMAVRDLLRSGEDVAVPAARAVLAAGPQPPLEQIAAELVARTASTPEALAELACGPGRCAVAAAEIMVADTAFPDGLLARVLGEGGAEAAVLAATALGRRGGGTALSALGAAIREGPPDVRDAAAVALGELADPGAIAPLCEALLTGAVERTRYGSDDERGPLRPSFPGPAGEALARYGGPAARELLLSLDAPGPVPRRYLAAAAATVAATGARHAAEALAEGGPAARLVAAAALGDVGGEAAISALVAAAAAGDDRLRATVAAALGQALAMPETAAHEAGAAALVRRLTDADARVRRTAREAARAAARTQPVIADGVGELLRTAPEMAVPAAAALAGAPRVAAVLAAAVASGDAEQRAHALGAIAAATAVDEAVVAPAVQAALGDDDPAVRRAARRASRALDRLTAEDRALYLRVEDREYRLAEPEVAYVAGPHIRGPRLRVDLGPRFVDIEAHEDAGGLHAASEPLEAGRWYRLAVFVRGEPSGVPVIGVREPLPEPGEAVDLLVAADSGDFELGTAVGRLPLPLDGEAREPAWLRVRATGPASPARIQLRIYHRWNLVQTVYLEAEVRARFAPLEPARETMIAMRHGPAERDIEALAGTVPRQLHIAVTRAGDRFGLAFGLGAAHEETFRTATPVTADEIESDLMGIRELWREVAIESPFTAALAPGEEAAARELARLAAAGSRLWTTLFKRESSGALAQVGRLLAEHPLPHGALIQVSAEPGAESFTFPWGLLYDRPLERGRPADPDGFWGARYVIEQGVPGMRRAPDAGAEERAEGLDLAFMLWRRFRNAKAHRAMIDRLEDAGGGRLRISAPPIMDADACTAALAAGTSDVLYFYTHGFTRRRGSSLQVDAEIARFTRRFAELGPDDPRRAPLAVLNEALTGGVGLDRSYIEFSFNRLYLDDLYGSITRLGRAPLVVLNMCESAQVSPSLSDGFAHFFLDRGAPAVIGTECPMTVDFAHPFGEQMLTRVLRGERFGDAVLAARRHFLATAGNPLGLAYTLYGSATARLLPAVLDPETANPTGGSTA